MQEREAGDLSAYPVCPTKETLDSLKVILPDGTVFTMSFFAKGNPE